MSNRKLSGYWIVVVSATLLVAVLAWFLGARLHDSPVLRVTLVLLAGAIVLLARGALTTAWRWAASFAPQRESRRHGRDPAARMGATKTSGAFLKPSWSTGLKETLHDRYGFRWRHRLPWLLLTGDDSAILRLLTPMPDSGWLVTDDAVLLWCRSGPDGQPDVNWLKPLYRLRRRRPVDAVVLTVDGTADLPAQRRGTGTHRVNLARITSTLRWSAPVYVLDVAGTDHLAATNTSVTGCDFPRHADTRAIESACRSSACVLPIAALRNWAATPMTATARNCRVVSTHASRRLPT